MRPGFNRCIPELAVTDIARSLAFYTQTLGFRVDYERPESGFAFLSLQGSQLMLEQLGEASWATGKMEPPLGRGMHLQLEVESVAPIMASLEAARHPIFLGVHEKWYRKGDRLLGNRQFLVQDPDGYLLRFAEDIGTEDR